MPRLACCLQHVGVASYERPAVHPQFLERLQPASAVLGRGLDRLSEGGGAGVADLVAVEVQALWGSDHTVASVGVACQGNPRSEAQSVGGA